MSEFPKNEQIVNLADYMAGIMTREQRLSHLSLRLNDGSQLASEFLPHFWGRPAARRRRKWLIPKDLRHVKRQKVCQTQENLLEQILYQKNRKKNLFWGLTSSRKSDKMSISKKERKGKKEWEPTKPTTVAIVKSSLAGMPPFTLTDSVGLGNLEPNTPTK